MSEQEQHIRNCISVCKSPADLALLTQALLNLKNAENTENVVKEFTTTLDPTITYIKK